MRVVFDFLYTFTEFKMFINSFFDFIITFVYTLINGVFFWKIDQKKEISPLYTNKKLFNKWFLFFIKQCIYKFLETKWIIDREALIFEKKLNCKTKIITK